MQMKRCIIQAHPTVEYPHVSGANPPPISLAFPPPPHHRKPVFSKRIFLVLSVIFSLSRMKAADTNLPALNLITAKRPLVIGHRGYCQCAPENTLPSFKLAMAAGADLVELDYYHTKDDQLIVMHDADLDRTTDATSRWGGKKIKVSSRTAAE